MYDSDRMAKRIKQTAREKGIALKVMLPQCGLGINALNQIRPDSRFSPKSLQAIADYMSVTVDFLLCYTDDPAEQIKKAPAVAGASEFVIRDPEFFEAVKDLSAEDLKKVVERAKEYAQLLGLKQSAGETIG